MWCMVSGAEHCVDIVLADSPHCELVLRSQIAFQGKGSGAKPMRHLCKDPSELGGDNCNPCPCVTRQPPAHNYRGSLHKQCIGIVPDPFSLESRLAMRDYL